MHKYFPIFLVLVNSLAQGENLDFSKDFIDAGACPFECCTYREWSVKRDTQLFAEKDSNSEKVIVVEFGSKIRALTGDVHVRPLKITVVTDYKTHHAGEIIWLLNYLGEGNYRAWKNGEFFIIELPFSPYGKMKPLEWGKIDGKYQMDWWVKLEAKTGEIGWSNEVRNFSNKDSCA